MHQVGTSKHVRFEEMLAVIEDITDRYSLSFNHISLTSIKAAFQYVDEVDISPV